MPIASQARTKRLGTSRLLSWSHSVRCGSFFAAGPGTSSANIDEVLAAAVDHLEKMLAAVQPRAVAPYLDLAQGQLRQRRFAKAEQTLTSILAREPTHPRALEWLAISRMALGKNTEAIELLRKALERSPNRAETHFNLALSLINSEQPEEALTSFQPALRLRPNMASAWFHLGNALVKLGRIDEAVGCYRKSLEIAPSNTRAYVAIGKTLLKKGDRDEARRYWLHGIKVARNPKPISTVMEKEFPSPPDAK